MILKEKIVQKSYWKIIEKKKVTDGSKQISEVELGPIDAKSGINCMYILEK